MKFPVFDTHCDLLSYLATVPNADPLNELAIPCALPLLKKGNVKAQVLAIYTTVEAISMQLALDQSVIFKQLLKKYADLLSPIDADFLEQIESHSQIGIIASIENAAGLATEDAPLERAFHQLEDIISHTGQLAYISLTHHTENRFGGGNYSEGVGLKDDGRRLLDYISEKKIPIDLSHTSDLLAEAILNHIDQEKLVVPVIASHSNFRAIWDHKRNLTDEFAQEIVHRKGYLGMNFLRAFLDNENSERIVDHILYGFQTGLEDHLCFGADFFYTHDFPDPSRHPFYFPIVEDASKYPSLLDKLSDSLSNAQLEKLAYQNVRNFYKNLWSKS
jgi:membrane dipeptidase